MKDKRIRAAIEIATEMANERAQNKADWDSTFVHALKGALKNDGIDIDLSGRAPLPLTRWDEGKSSYSAAVLGSASPKPHGDESPC